MNIIIAFSVVSWSARTVQSYHSIYCKSSYVSPFYSLPSTQTSLSSSFSTVGEAYCTSLGGTLKKIKMENEDDGLLASVSVPTFAAFDSLPRAAIAQPNHEICYTCDEDSFLHKIPGAFQLNHVLSRDECEDIIRVCEEDLKFHTYSSSLSNMKNNHGALQVLITKERAKSIADRIEPWVIKQWESYMDHRNNTGKMIGINRRWRIYRYRPGEEERFLPHIDAAFPPSGLSHDSQTMKWDVSSTDEEYKEYAQVVSRLTILFYLNQDFEGGATNFFRPLVETVVGNPSNDPFDNLELLASVQPKAGSVLFFPQAVGEEEVDFARVHWPLHEGSPVIRGNRGKYVIRSDVLFAYESKFL